MSKLLILTFPAAAGLLALEELFLKGNFGHLLYENNRAYAAVLLVNVVLSGLCITALGFKVGAARKKFREKAIKDGEKQAEERYSYPNLYVDGNTTNAKLFNCAQRGHQQALETYPQFLAFSYATAMRFPLSAALLGLLWCYARWQWAAGYASGDPANRYSHWASYGIWTALIALLVGALATAIGMLGAY